MVAYSTHCSTALLFHLAMYVLEIFFCSFLILVATEDPTVWATISLVIPHWWTPSYLLPFTLFTNSVVRSFIFLAEMSCSINSCSWNFWVSGYVYLYYRYCQIYITLSLSTMRKSGCFLHLCQNREPSHPFGSLPIWSSKNSILLQFYF